MNFQLFAIQCAFSPTFFPIDWQTINKLMIAQSLSRSNGCIEQHKYKIIHDNTNMAKKMEKKLYNVEIDTCDFTHCVPKHVSHIDSG